MKSYFRTFAKLSDPVISKLVPGELYPYASIERDNNQTTIKNDSKIRQAGQVISLSIPSLVPFAQFGFQLFTITLSSIKHI